MPLRHVWPAVLRAQRVRIMPCCSQCLGALVLSSLFLPSHCALNGSPLCLGCWFILCALLLHVFLQGMGTASAPVKLMPDGQYPSLSAPDSCNRAMHLEPMSFRWFYTNTLVMTVCHAQAVR